MACYASDLIAVAKSMVGYTEKATNSNLDSMTGNTGHNNYTKFAYEIATKYPDFYNGNKNGYAWCDLFYDWCMIKAFGIDNAYRLLCQPKKSAGAGCPYSYGYYKAKGRVGETPKLGAQIFFGYSESDLYHTGMVVAFDITYVWTVEGNANDKVSELKYYRTNAKIFGYGYPAFDGDSNPNGSSTPSQSNSDNSNSSNNSSSSGSLSRTVAWTGTVNQDYAPRTWAGAANTLKSISKVTKGSSIGVCSSLKGSDGKDWYYVLINDSIYGFVPASIVDKPAAVKIEAHDGSKGLSRAVKTTGTVNTSSLNVRTWAGTKYSRLVSIPSISYGTQVQICDAIYDDNHEPWYFVLINGNTYGFVHSQYITLSNGTVSTPTVTTSTAKTTTSGSDIPVSSSTGKTT